MIQKLNSRQNPHIKLVRGLKDKKGRDSSGLYFVEGLRLAEEALQKSRVEQAYFAPRLEHSPRGKALLDALTAAAVPLFSVSDELLAYMADTKESQGVLLVLPQMPLTAAAAEARLTLPLTQLLVLDGVKDPGNLGAVLRSAAAAGVAMVILTGGCCDPFNPKVCRASMGGVLTLPLCRLPQEQALALLRRLGAAVCLADMGGQDIYRMDQLPKPVAWVMGGEAAGASSFWRANADLTVSLPMAQGSESLNVAVAASLLIYETLRKSF